MCKYKILKKGVRECVLQEYGVRAIQSLYTQSGSCVHALGSKSGEGWPPSGLCLITNPVCDIHGQDVRAGEGWGGVQFGGLKIAKLFFADDVVLMASSCL